MDTNTVVDKEYNSTLLKIWDTDTNTTVLISSLEYLWIKETIIVCNLFYHFFYIEK